MKKVLFLMVVALVCFGWSKAYADYSFNFMSYNGNYGVQGTLLTPSNGSGPLTVTGGSVVGDGTLNIGVSCKYNYFKIYIFSFIFLKNIKTISYRHFKIEKH